MTWGSLDRRHFHRSGIGDHGIVSARVRPGRLVAVIDVSAGGTLIETSQPLFPGAAVDLQFESAFRRTSLRGHVLRCAVARLHPSAVSYRAAIVFDRQWPCFVDGEWSEYPVPTSEARSISSEGVSSTPNEV
jgi:hypothetical protein